MKEYVTYCIYIVTDVSVVVAVTSTNKSAVTSGHNHRGASRFTQSKFDVLQLGASQTLKQLPVNFKMND